MTPRNPIHRRAALASILAAGGAAALAGSPAARARALRARRDGESDAALFAVTLDLEMARHYPTRDQTHWDYEKGNLDDDTKACAVEAARRVREAGSHLHFFVVGRVFEQESVEWLRGIVRDGHPVGNHTYDHVNLRATEPAELQFRFQRAPWLIEGQSVEQVIESNIRLTTRAMETRLGVRPSGFRAPGGFPNGLDDRPDLRATLRRLGFDWISSRYPPHPTTEPGRPPDDAVVAGILRAQAEAQPRLLPDGLVEVPMSPVSDVTAFRSQQWSLDDYLRVLAEILDHVVERRMTFDFLAHPSCLHVVDPGFKIIDAILARAARSGGAARVATLDAFAARARRGD